MDVESHHLGYQLKSPLYLFDKNKIQDLLKDDQLTLEIFETIPSTNDYLKDKKPSRSTHICLAEHMSKGRGRLGRSWVSPFGRNLYCSLSLSFNKDSSEMAGLSLVVGILVAKALESLYPSLHPFLKWPNDIYVNHQKMGGILIDLVAEAHGNCRAIIGIGLNINMKDMNANLINQPWISLEHVLNEKIDRSKVSASIIKFILEGVDRFIEKGMAAFLTDWKRYDLLYGKEVALNIPHTPLSGIAKGINEHGHLLIELPSGETKQCSYGDTSLIKNHQ